LNFYTSLNKFYKASTSGNKVRSGLENYRFKSSPANEFLKLPIVTPSGFIIGIILKIKLFNKAEN
jgi:hypothetical protein